MLLACGDGRWLLYLWPFLTIPTVYGMRWRGWQLVKEEEDRMVRLLNRTEDAAVLSAAQSGTLLSFRLRSRSPGLRLFTQPSSEAIDCHHAGYGLIIYGVSQIQHASSVTDPTAVKVAKHNPALCPARRPKISQPIDSRDKRTVPGPRRSPQSWCSHRQGEIRPCRRARGGCVHTTLLNSDARNRSFDYSTA